MPPIPVRLYFDYISPNAYLAWSQLPALAARHGAAVTPVPVLFAGLLEAHGRLGPAEIPVQMRWMWKNVKRKAALLGLPLSPPAFHPFNPLLALRVSSLPLANDERHALIDALFAAVWARGLEVSEPQVVAEIANGIGLDGSSIVAAAQEPDAKARLRDQTADAIARDVFGVPSMEAGGEMFWGYDDFPYLELYLSGKDPLLPEDRKTWSAPLAPSAVRERQARRP